MNILAIDTSQDVLSLALSSPGGIFQTEIHAGTRHSELLMEWVDRLICSAGLKPEDLELAACMKGPGAFTGLRIGYAAAKGLSFALGIPFAAVPTLDCMALPHSVWPGIVLAVMDAKKNCFFTAFYRGRERLSEYMDADINTIQSVYGNLKTPKDVPLLLTGSGAELFISRNTKGPLFPSVILDPFYFRGRSMEMLQLLKDDDMIKYIEGESSAPLYLRKSDAELSLN